MKLRRKALAITIVAATLLGQALTSAAHADDPAVNIQVQAIHDRLFSAAVRLRTQGPNGLKDMVLSNALVAWRQQHPQASAQQLTELTAQMKGYFDSQLTADDLTRPTYELLMRLFNLVALHPSGAAAGPALKEVLDAAIGKDIKAYADWTDQVASAQFSYSYFDRIYPIQDRVWGEVTRMAQADPAFAQAWDGHFGARIGVSATATTDQLKADPLIGMYVNVEAIMDRQHQMSAYIQEGQRQLDETLAQLLTQNDAMIGHLRALAIAYPATTTGPRPTDQVLQRERADAANRQRYLDGAATAVQVLSTLLSFADPKAGKVAAGVGKAAIQVATAINNYLPAIAGLGLGQALTSMSTVALTGNILGAIGGLIPLFAGGQSPEELMLTELRAIRQDIADLKGNMNDRFDRVESALTTIYGDMLARFDQLLSGQVVTLDQLRSIEQRLLALTTQVDMWGTQILASLQQAALRPMKSTINQYIHYVDKWHEPIGNYQLQYVPAATELRSAATEYAAAAPFTGPAIPQDDDPGNDETDLLVFDPMYVLDTWKPNGSIMYLHAYAKHQYGLPAQGGVSAVADPAVWTTATRAYAMLESENPEFARRSDMSVPGDVISAGEKILNTTQQLSAPREGNGPRTNALFTGLMNDYRTATERFSGELGKIRAGFHAQDYDMFGSPDQPLGADQLPADLGQVEECDGAGMPVSRPAQVTAAGTPHAYTFAQYANPGAARLKLCYTAYFVNEQVSQIGQWEITRADLEVTMRVRLQWGTDRYDHRTWTKTWPLGEVCRQRTTGEPSGTCHSPGWYMLDRWNSTFKPQFVSAADQTHPASADQVRSRMHRIMAGKQAAYYNVVVDRLADPRSDLAKANDQMTRLVRLLRAYTKLGFARTLQHDELMTLVLFGADSLPADLPGSPMVTRTFQRARDNYGACRAPSPGAPCAPGTGPFYAQANHAWPAWSCPSVTAPRSGDVLADCLWGHAFQRMNLLAHRYEYASGQLAANSYDEGMPQVRELVQTLSAVATVVRAQPTP